MSVSLSDFFARLPDSEIDRLQKRLRVILRNCHEPRRLRRTLRTVFENLGPPSRALGQLGPEALNTFQKLLDNFGTLTRSQLKVSEQELLERMPYVVWTDAEHCVLCEEAEDTLRADPYFKDCGYLFSTLNTLPAREKKAWAAWLQMTGTHITRANLERELYHHLAESRRIENETTPVNESGEYEARIHAENLPRYLRDVFPEDDTRFPVAWFYRGILPLYNALSETARTTGQLDPIQKSLLKKMKIGQVVVRNVPAEFGEPERWRLVWTRESWEDSAPEAAPAEPKSEQQGQLSF